MTKEALKLALEALETLMIERGSIYDQAITAVQRALAQPEQEPVAWAKFSAKGNIIDLLNEPDDEYTPLYTTPPQRTWVGLTRIELIKCGVLPFGMSYELYEAIEQALKERNT